MKEKKPKNYYNMKILQDELNLSLDIKEFNQIIKHINTIVNNLRLPIDMYPDYWQKLLFSNRVGNKVKNRLIVSADMKDLYLRQRYRMKDLEFIKSFLSFKKTRIKDLMYLNEPRFQRIIYLTRYYDSVSSVQLLIIQKYIEYDDRDAFTLMYFYDFKQNEIASELGLSRGRVSQMVKNIEKSVRDSFRC